MIRRPRVFAALYATVVSSTLLVSLDAFGIERGASGGGASAQSVVRSTGASERLPALLSPVAVTVPYALSPYALSTPSTLNGSASLSTVPAVALQSDGSRRDAGMHDESPRPGKFSALFVGLGIALISILRRFERF